MPPHKDDDPNMSPVTGLAFVNATLLLQGLFESVLATHLNRCVLHASVTHQHSKKLPEVNALLDEEQASLLKLGEEIHALHALPLNGEKYLKTVELCGKLVAESAAYNHRWAQTMKNHVDFPAVRLVDVSTLDQKLGRLELVGKGLRRIVSGFLAKD